METTRVGPETKGSTTAEYGRPQDDRGHSHLGFLTPVGLGHCEVSTWHRRDESDEQTASRDPRVERGHPIWPWTPTPTPATFYRHCESDRGKDAAGPLASEKC